jgi:hypothetical protein
VQAKEWWSVHLKSIVTHNLGDGVRPIEKWVNLLMGPCKVLLLQVYPYLVSNLKLVRYPMMIMVFLVLSISFLQNLLDMLADVLNLLNESGGCVNLILNMGRVCLCGGHR